MAKIDPDKYGVNTLAVRAGRAPTAEGEHSEPGSARTNPGISIPGSLIPRCAPLKNGWPQWRAQKAVSQPPREWAPY